MHAKKITANVEIVAMAQAISEIAQKCWPDLGTEASTRIQINMVRVMETATRRPKQAQKKVKTALDTSGAAKTPQAQS